MGKVKSRKRDSDGNPIGRSNSNPILDTRVYQVEFPDGDVAEYTANVIAENIFAQVDDEGRHHQLLDSIVDHRRDQTAFDKDKDEERFVYVNGKRHLRKTTQGWELCVLWRDKSTSWVRLADLRWISYPGL